MALRNLRGADETGQTSSWEVSHALASRAQGLTPASGAGVLKPGLNEREEEGEWPPAGSPVEPLSDSFGVGGKSRGD